MSVPGWPTVGRTDDQRLAEALRRADAQAPARLFDAYAERLNDYAFSLLADVDAAADAVHDTLVVAHGCADRLRDAGRLRPWLYALVRFRCAAGSRGGRGTGPSPVGDEPDDPAERELAVLVRETLAELGGQEREVLELSLRHGLSSGEVGAVLGLTSRQAATRLGRARDHLENTAAAVVLARVGRAHCPDLSAMVDSWEGPLSPALRRRLSAHIARCEVCAGLRDRHVPAGRLLDLLPVALPPLSLRRRTIATCVDPGQSGARAAVVAAGDRFDRSGFPVAGERRAVPRAARRRKRAGRSAPAVAAALCVLAATAGVIVVTGQDLVRGPAGRADAAPGPEPAMIASRPAPSDASPEPEEPGTEEPAAEEPGPEPTESARSTAPASGPGTGRAAASRPDAPRPAADRPRATRPPAPRPSARLTVSCPSSIGAGAGRIRLAARGAAVEWSATASGGLVVHPGSGRLRAGASALIWVTAADPGESGSGRVAFRSSGGDTGCAVSWDGPAPEDSEPAPDPTEAPEPTPTPSASPEQEAA
jgi:DNA-directed RNA polymerase specialized sigma24 family protein